MRPIKITEDCIIYNDMPYGWAKGEGQPAWHRSLYDRWRDMWRRCRNPESSRYENYKDCPIDDRYHLLSNYVNDVQLLDDFDLLKENPSKYSIDKDKKDPNNRCYYFEHLSIVTDSENSKERTKRRGKLNPPKPIIGININDNTILIFKSSFEASKCDFFKFDQTRINRCCNYPDKHKSHNGYIWKFL